ncbi:MAG TPA: MarR family transcriptional regulator [Gemmatimonadetes bacterium]|jgi:DNA-binding MarR family transcriptional regulator|nr:MarR family transcriptional regulator [Gemmatimonadota bacterium]
MSDVNTLLGALPRIYSACRARQVRDPLDGGVVSAHQASILSHLDSGDPTMVGELADHLGVTASTMSLNLTRLEKAGYIARERDPADRRVMNVRLTEAGERLSAAQTVLDPERIDRMLHELSPGARTDAMRGLVLLSEAADALIRRGRAFVESAL